jgi:hypothetical protein
MDAGARRWRQSNFPNLTEHIAPHKDGIGISDAKAIVDAPLQHRYTLSSKTNALWKGDLRRAARIPSADARGVALARRSECRFAAMTNGDAQWRPLPRCVSESLSSPATSNR